MNALLLRRLPPGKSAWVSYCENHFPVVLAMFLKFAGRPAPRAAGSPLTARGVLLGLVVRRGLTGLAQINGSRNIAAEDKNALDFGVSIATVRNQDSA